jgi:SpoVK/Ycf46/Vps4 family AAA+-type ATPase
LSSSRKDKSVSIDGFIPGAAAGDAALLRSRMVTLVSDFAAKTRPDSFQLVIRHGNPPVGSADRPGDNGHSLPGKTERNPGKDDLPEFIAIEANYRLDQVVLPIRTMERLLDCISFVEVAPLVFDTWGLKAIEPHPSIAVNFRGPPGTGKTMAAHAAAQCLGKKIMLSRLSDLESKYHGQGPKNLVGLFQSAADQDAIVFIDEAESLLSRRFAQPEQAAESAINSMRTELLMALDSFDGLVIFASNLPHSYDMAIESRLLHVDFDLPDRDGRRAIWSAHLPAGLPLDKHASFSEMLDRLADIDGVSGRDIKLAVISAAVGTARRKADWITEELLVSSLERQRGDRSAAAAPAKETDNPDLVAKIKAQIGQATPAGAQSS